MLLFEQHLVSRLFASRSHRECQSSRSLRNHEVLRVCALCFSFLAAVVPSHLFGQAATASISGRITDASSAAVPNATVTIKNTATSVTQTANTDEQGRYALLDLPIGPYDLTVSKTGFQNLARTGLVLTVGSAPVLDLQMTVGQATETVNVNAEAVQVETSTAAVSSLVNQTQMRELPLNGRDWEQLILLAPGVASYPQGGSSALTSVANAYSIAGTRPEGYANTLDGEDMLNWWQRNAGGDVTGTTLGIDAIAEFQTLTGTYGAQYGGNGGAIIGVTKSGTNEFHGSAYEFFRNSALDSRGFFDGASVPEFRRNQYGGTIGGPIKKNKVFFFANYEGIREFLDTTYVNYVPGPNFVADNCPPSSCTVNKASAAMLALYPAANAGVLPGTNSDVGIYNFVGGETTPEDFGVVRVDWNISDKDAMFGRYEADFGTRTTNAGLGLWPLYDTTHNQFLTLGERHIFSPNLINQFTASYSRPWTSETQGGTNAALQLFSPGREDADVAVPNLTSLGDNFVNPFRYLQNKFTEKDDLTWTKGSHTLRIGGMFQRQQLNPYVLVFWNGFYVFNSGLPGCSTGPKTADQCFLTGNPLLFEGAPNGGTNSYRAERYDAVQPYFQDDWKVSSRLTINLGLRYEWETNPIEVHNLFTNVVGPPFAPNFVSVPHAYANNPSNMNFDPRVGLAWDVFGDHKTAVRAGFGIFHDPYTTYNFSSAYVSSPPYDTQLQFFFGGDPNWPTPLAGGGAAPSYSQTTGTYYGTNTTPYSLEYTLSIQRELPWNNLFTVGYQGTRGVHLLAFHDFNAPIPTVINGVDYFATDNGGPCPLNPAQGACNTNPRPVPALGSQDLTDPSSYSSYNALQAGLTHRASANLVYQLSYTYCTALTARTPTAVSVSIT